MDRLRALVQEISLAHVQLVILCGVFFTAGILWVSQPEAELPLELCGVSSSLPLLQPLDGITYESTTRVILYISVSHPPTTDEQPANLNFALLAGYLGANLHNPTSLQAQNYGSWQVTVRSKDFTVGRFIGEG